MADICIMADVPCYMAETNIFFPLIKKKNFFNAKLRIIGQLEGYPFYKLTGRNFDLVET